MTSESIYQHLFALTTIMKQRVVDNFDADSLNERWREKDVVGTGTFAMDDSVDGGFKITTGNTLGDTSGIDFNDIRQYSPTASIMIAVWSADNITSGLAESGLHNVLSAGNFITARLDETFAFYYLRTHDGTAGTNTFSDIADDTVFHNHKLEKTSSNAKLFIDGVLKATKTDRLPTAKLQPAFRRQNTSVAPTSMKIRFAEAFSV